MDSPLLIVDANNYNKKKYCEQFFNELTNTTYKTRGYGRFYYFKKGKFIKCIDDILAEDLSVLEWLIIIMQNNENHTRDLRNDIYIYNGKKNIVKK